MPRTPLETNYKRKHWVGADLRFDIRFPSSQCKWGPAMAPRQLPPVITYSINAVLNGIIKLAKYETNV